MIKNYRWILTGLFGLTGLLCTQATADERRVSAQPLASIATARTLQFPARVVNLQLASIAAETNGRITGFPVQVGDRVNKGQLLAELDCQSAQINQTRIQAGIKQLNARRQLTQQQLERAQRLSTTSSISREELDQRKTQLEADNAGIEEQQALLLSAQKSAADCLIKAPFSGMVVEKSSSIGSYASIGIPLLKLLKPEAVEIQLELPADLIPQLIAAEGIHFHSAGSEYKLKLRRVLPLVDSASLQQIVRLTIDQATLPAGGSYGLLSFDTARHYIPSRYVQKRNGAFGVFILNGERAEFRMLPEAEQGQAVKTSLAADTLIIDSHLQLLNDNEKVQTQP